MEHTPRSPRGQRTVRTPSRAPRGASSFGRKKNFSSGQGGFGGRNFKRSPGVRGRSSSKASPKRGMDIHDFIRRTEESMGQPEVVHEIKHTFADFAFSKSLSDNLKHKGYTVPSPIQDASIPHALQGRDIVGLASTGSGKTAAFLLPLIEKISKNTKTRVLILAPTRELATQIEREFKTFTFRMNISSTVCVGGMPIGRQIQALNRDPHVVIGTPGRLKDLLERRNLDLSRFENIVVDEFDRMLDMGFIDDITLILSKLNPVRQSFFFSATLPDRIKRIVDTFLKDPIVIEVSKGKTAHNVRQEIIQVGHDSDRKFEMLHKTLKDPTFSKVLIFNETKSSVDRLSRDLRKHGFKADSIHGDKRQRERDRALLRFTQNEVTILVATDVASRGIDVRDITHVINYTVPRTFDDYVHRIGRTGRAGKKGVALTFI